MFHVKQRYLDTSKNVSRETLAFNFYAMFHMKHYIKKSK